MIPLFLDIETNGEDTYSEKYLLRLIGYKTPGCAPKVTYPGHKDFENVKSLIQSKDTRVVAWSNYDYFGLKSAGVVPANYYDLKIPFKLYNENWRLSLDEIIPKIGFQSHKYLVKMWEQEGYNWATVPMEHLVPYNKLDVQRTSDAWEWVQGKFPKDQDEFLQKANRALIELQGVGIGFDPAASENLRYCYEGDLAVKWELLKNQADINWNSGDQVGDYLKSQKIPIRLTPKKNYRIDEEYLETHKDQYPVLSDLLNYRRLNHLYETYVVGVRDSVKGDGLLHPRYSWASTWRYRTSAPNIQNFPKKSSVRKVIVSKFPGGKLVEVDWSQLELRLMAVTADDKVLLGELQQGQDIHQRTATELGVSRDEGKSINFLIRYGGSAWKIHKTFPVSLEKAEWFVAQQYRRYPAMKVYSDMSQKKCWNKEPILTLFGRPRHTTSLNEALNSPIQSAGADLNKLVLLYTLETGSTYTSHPVFDVHDALIFDVAPEEFQKYLDNVIKKAYAGISELVGSEFGGELGNRFRQLTWPYKIKVGINYAKMGETE